MARRKRAAAIDAGPVDGPWALPEGWRWERLGRLLHREAAKHLPDPASDLCFVGMDNIVSHEMRASGVVPFRQMRSAGSAFEPGDVLYGRLRPYLNKVWVSDRAGACSGELLVLRPTNAITAKWLAFNLHSHRFVDYASNAVTGDRPRIDFDQIAQFPIALPPLPVQRSTVALAEALLQDVDEGSAALAEARSATDIYRQSLLNAAITGSLSADWRSANPNVETGHALLARICEARRARWACNPKNARKIYSKPAAPETGNLPILPPSWAWATLPMLGDFGRGKSKHRPRNDPKLYGGAYPFIQTGIVSASNGEIDEFDQTYSELGLSQSKLWPRGTVCITIAANIAKTGVLNFDACFPDSIVGLTCAEGVLPQFVELFVRSVQAHLEAYAPATAQKNINLETFAGLAVPLPPTLEQAEIVKIARSENGLSALAEGTAWAEAIAALRQSILASAFRGDLHPRRDQKI